MMLRPGSHSKQPSLHAHGSMKSTSHSSSEDSDSSSNATTSKRQGDYLTALAIMRPCVLDYDVHSCSSYSASYLPENIKTNNPQDQSSRWSSGSNNQMQYIMIKLKTMAIAHTITFGKYHKVHVCNLKEFKVYGGLTTSNMTELLHTGLRNDHEPETFLLKHKTNTVVFPCQYIKIVPLMAWGANFNFSVWHVEVKGIPDPELVQEAYFQYINFRETESVRLCLKHFRQRKLFDAFKALQERTHIQLEDALLTKLHQELVLRGNFKRAEELMAEAAERGLFDEYIRTYDYKPIWRRLGPNTARQSVHHHHYSHQASHEEESPRRRGGHQMCIDTKGGYVYLMGGWDGARDLADFWAYHIPSQKWILISADTSLQGGPGARSCHKICYSPQHRALFLLGRYVDPDNRSKVDLSPDFWRFDIDPLSPPHGRWTKICSNTAVMNGPELVYDHQMCLDPVSQTLYVFGGRVVHLDKNVQHYSGLYSYQIPSGVWRLLRADGHPSPKQDGSTVLRSRIGHSMLYDEMMRSLVVFAGQMNKDYLSDFYVYDIAADRVIEVCKDYNKQGGPEAGFTQRATISSKGREIYVLSGLVKDRALGAETVKNSFWVFKLPGEDQMHAIRDVQRALTNAKTSGSIGSLKSIMRHGRSLSEHLGQDESRTEDTTRSRGSRRKVHEVGHRQNESRQGSTTSGSISHAVTDERQSSPDRGSSSRTRQTRFSDHNVDQGSVFSVPSSSSLSVRSSRSRSEASVSSATLEPFDRKEIEPSIRDATFRASTGRGRHSSSGTMCPGVSKEPMSLAYVLSDQGSWQKIFQNSNPELGEPCEPEPVPRYAHQLVYDDVNEVQYLFGGNPGEQGNMSKRLDDFWELRLYRPKPEQILRKAKYLLRTQQFKELCLRPETSVLTSTTATNASSDGANVFVNRAPTRSRRVHQARDEVRGNSKNGRSQGPVLIQRGTQEHQVQSHRALKFLQTELNCVVDHSNACESEDFKALIRGLLLGAFSPTAGIASTLLNSSQRKDSPTNGIESRASPSSRTNNGHNQKTTVLLAPSPVASPALGGVGSMLYSPNISSSHASGMRPFLASPTESSFDGLGFESSDGNNGNDDDDEDEDEDGDEEDQEDEDSPMCDSFLPPSTSRTRLRPSRDDIDLQGLDQNGDRICTSEHEAVQDVKSEDDARIFEAEERMDEQEPKGGTDFVDEAEYEQMTGDDDDLDPTMKGLYRDRTLLYEKLLDFFAESVKQPKGDLTDLVKVG
ncbi:hypothetical protein BGX28_007454 [Mortierella sp. GBA30]|nr:hypothetical protein BGX28_007454 [Mortierella sp. GBA30]